MSRGLAVALMLCALPNCKSSPAGDVQVSSPDWIDRIVNEEALAHHVPGLGLTIVIHGRVVAERAYGLADVERALPVTTSTAFNIASVSKLFTSAVVLRMASRGEIDLEAPARRYLEWLPSQFESITIRQLLTHTSGIVRDVRRGNDDDPVGDEYRERIIAAERSAEPGARWEYSNTGYAVLGWAAEAASGMAFERLLEREAFTVAKMPDARFRTPLSEPDRALPYRWVGDTLEREHYVSGGFGSGGLILSTRDFTAFAQSLHAKQLLSSEMLELAWSPGRLADGSTSSLSLMSNSDSYGCGWILTHLSGQRLVAHGGGIAGFSAQLLHFPDSEITIAVIANVKGRDDGQTPVDPIARRIAAHLVAELPDAPAEPAQAASFDARESVKRAVLDYVEGIYDVDPTRIERSVHPKLAKLGFWRARAGEAYVAESMTYEQLIEVSRQFNSDRSLPHDAPREIEVLDVQHEIASAKLTASWGIDYLQLAKFDGRWQIVHVLWESQP